MRDLMHELEYAMAGELENYVGLLQYAKEKKAALINNDLDELDVLVKLENEIVNRLKTVAVQRESLFEAIANEDGFAGIVDLEYVLQKLPAAERTTIEQLRDRYKSIIRDLSALNSLNQNLLQTQLQYTEFCIDILTKSSFSSNNMYGSTGFVNTENVAIRRLIDQEA